MRDVQKVVGEYMAQREREIGDTRSPLSPGGREGFGTGGGPTEVLPVQVSEKRIWR